MKAGGVNISPFTVLQSIRQGGVASTVDYKEYVNDLLMTLEDSGVGAFMGDIYY